MAVRNQILVTLCTYQERENLQTLIPAILNVVPEADILVIDDNSPDGTGEYVDQLAQEDSRIRAIHRPGKLGLGTATMAGFQYGIDHNYEWLINLDADWSHPPRFLPEMLKRAPECDVVIGSRYIAGGKTINWGLTRQLMSLSLNLYARTVLGLSTRDNSGSFRCYRVSKLKDVDWSKARAHGYAIEEEILYRLRKQGAVMIEVPITYEERRFGETKLEWKEAISAGWTLLHLRLKK